MPPKNDIKPGSGVLFVNKRKFKPQAPDFTGQFIHLDGKLYAIAAWINGGDDNRKKFFKIVVSEYVEPGKRPDTTMLEPLIKE